MRKPNYLPSRELELQLLHQLTAEKKNAVLAGVDEVGRGSLAGPVSVGIALIDSSVSQAFPEKLRDSKQISAKVRESLVDPCMKWTLASAVGSASVSQINAHGIVAGLRLAAADAVAQLCERGYQIDAVLLDGSHDWWSTGGLFDIGTHLPDVPVQMVVKGDAQCAVIAAASVLAKVRRDQYMEQLAQQYPQYDWEHNKGYASWKHITAISEFGPSEFHRTSWNLPGMDEFVRREKHGKKKHWNNWK